MNFSHTVYSVYKSRHQLVKGDQLINLKGDIINLISQDLHFIKDEELKLKKQSKGKKTKIFL